MLRIFSNRSIKCHYGWNAQFTPFVNEKRQDTFPHTSSSRARMHSTRSAPQPDLEACALAFSANSQSSSWY